MAVIWSTKGRLHYSWHKENKKKKIPSERFIIQGIKNPKKQVEDFGNTINSSKVSVNILKDAYIDFYAPHMYDSKHKSQ